MSDQQRQSQQSAAGDGGSFSKIHGRHRDRLAVVYVRQSTLYQVHHHQESGRLQYALKDRAIQLGWSPQRVVVIDDDQGQSGASAEHRAGFQRLVAEVGLNHVGIVFGIEMSRLARSNSDWYRLLDICTLFQTLIADGDGIYDPRDYNDRLVLGLKGTMSEAELHILKQRLNAGRLAKAHRGELRCALPMGYVRRPSGEVIKEPDEQARGVIDLIFTTFDRCRSINGVVRSLLAHGVQFPIRERCGPERGRLRWSRPNCKSLRNLFHNPTYAGAYVYGRRHGTSRPVSGDALEAVALQPLALEEEWEVCLRDRLPAYISWQEYARNVRQLRANCPQRLGVPRQGVALLSGLVVCGRCGRRMTTRYSTNGKGVRYLCDRQNIRYQQTRCQSVPGEVIDEAVSRVVLRALEPMAVELSLQVANDLEAERQRLLTHWQQRLERARYDADRAFRQYTAVEPENRLVARQLERQWESALHTEAALQLEYDRFAAQQPVPLRPDERDAIRRCARDIPTLWQASTTTASDRKALVRQLIDRVEITLTGNSEQMTLDIQWAGGAGTSIPLIRPVASLTQLSYYPDLLQRAMELRTAGTTLQAIAQHLTDEDWRPVSGHGPWTFAMVCHLFNRPEAGTWTPTRRRLVEGIQREPHEWTSQELAEALGMTRDSLNNWVQKGRLRMRKVPYGKRCVRLIWADDDELERLRDLRAHPQYGPARPRVEMPPVESHLPTGPCPNA